MGLSQIAQQFGRALQAYGVSAEITFCRTDMFSVLVDDASQLETAKAVISQVHGVAFDSEDRDPECGSVAYFRF